MEYEELKELNYAEKPSRSILLKALLEWDGIITFYREQSKKDKRHYWRGKIGHKIKERKIIIKKLINSAKNYGN